MADHSVTFMESPNNDTRRDEVEVTGPRPPVVVNSSPSLVTASTKDFSTFFLYSPKKGCVKNIVFLVTTRPHFTCERSIIGKSCCCN
jgi:hypothetical protein